MSEKEKNKKSSDVSFLQAFNRPRLEVTPTTDNAWKLMKSRMKQLDAGEGEKDERDVFELKNQDKKEPARDGLDRFQNTLLPENSQMRDGLDTLQKEDEKPSENKENRVDRLERDYQPVLLKGGDSLLKSKECKIELGSVELFVETSDTVYGMEKQKISALHLQLMDITLGLEKNAIPFEKRDQYLLDIEQYIRRKKKVLSRFYGLQEPGTERIKFFLNRGFEVFSQSLNELRIYLKDYSVMHLTLARQLSEEGNRIFLKVKEQMALMRGVKNV